MIQVSAIVTDSYAVDIIHHTKCREVIANESLLLTKPNLMKSDKEEKTFNILPQVVVKKTNTRRYIEGSKLDFPQENT